MGTVLQFARPGYDHTIDVDLSVKSCPVCSILYAVPKQLMDRCSQRNESWYCPNGHSLHFIESDLNKSRKEADRAAQRARDAEDTARRWRDRAEAERRSAIAYRGHLTRIRRRMTNGVCPVPGCKRSGFEQVMRHIASQHADWLAEHPEVA